MSIQQQNIGETAAREWSDSDGTAAGNEYSAAEHRRASSERVVRQRRDSSRRAAEHRRDSRTSARQQRDSRTAENHLKMQLT